MKYLLSGLFVSLLLSGCGSKNLTLLQPNQEVTSNERVVKTENINGVIHTTHSKGTFEYRIMPHDRLAITLYKNPEEAEVVGDGGELGRTLNKDGVIVDSRGYITLPLIKKVKVAGLTQTRAADRITARFKKYLKNPSVYVEAINKKAYILGEVKKPGVLDLDKEKVTLLQAIAMAGDLTDNAVRDNIIILSHTHSGKMTIRKVDLTKLASFHYLKNMMIKPNDVIYVQPDGWKEFKVTAENISPIFRTVGTMLQPFAYIKTLSD